MGVNDNHKHVVEKWPSEINMKMALKAIPTGVGEQGPVKVGTLDILHMI